MSAASFAAFAEEVRVPVTIALSRPIAGAQFRFHYTDGLEFLSFERSDAVQSAMMTPTVAKDGNIHIGFFGRENNFFPQNGELNAGYLVFNYSSALIVLAVVVIIRQRQALERSKIQNIY